MPLYCLYLLDPRDWHPSAGRMSVTQPGDGCVSTPRPVS